jgi:hypothetical protein
MELAPVGVPLSFEVTFTDPGLHVAMSVYDDSGLFPVLVVGPSAMLNWVGNSYRGKFIAPMAKSYLILKAVYTDGSFSTLSPDYVQATESILAQYMNNAGGGCGVVGLVIC